MFSPGDLILFRVLLAMVRLKTECLLCVIPYDSAKRDKQRGAVLH